MEIRDDLEKIVGKERVVTDSDILTKFQSDSSFTKGEIPEFMVKPGNGEQVMAIVKLANEKGFPLVPCSSREGVRFNGDTVPLKKGSVIVDLSDMNSIIRVDKRNKVAMVEPGVTFGELIAAVDKEGLRVEMPMLPKKEKSVLASLLDREPTTAPKYNWDAIDPLCCLEMVFGAGDLFRTGNAAGPGSLEEQWAAGQAQKVSMGPAQTDLARVVQGSQGTLGIATWATIKLELKPTLRKGFMVEGDRLEALIDFAYKLLWRKIPDVCLLLNRVNLAAICGVDSRELPPWVLVYSISGLEYLPQERVAYMETDIHEIAQTYDVKPSRNISGIAADKLVDIVTRPSGDTYWKLRPKGACQDLFFLTTIEKAPVFIEALETAAKEHDFSKENMGVYIQPIRHGTGCHLEFNFMHAPGEEEKVQALFESAGRKCLDMGGFFSRPHGAMTHMVYSKCPDTVSALTKIKNIFDPNGVMNPGKLCFRKEA